MQPLRFAPIRMALVRAAAWTCAVVLLCSGRPAGAQTAAEKRDQQAEATATAVLNHLVDDLWAHSDHYFHAGDYETTARVDRLVVRLDPNFVDGVTTLAWLLRQGLNRPKEALTLYHRGIEDNPDRWEIYFDLGGYFYDQKDYARAAGYYRGAVERDAPAVKRHMLAHAYVKMGRRDDAIATWRAIIEKFPDDAVAKKNLDGLLSQDQKPAVGDQ